MNKIYYLKTCDTCKRILKQIDNIQEFQLQDIKEQPITVKQLDEIYAHTKSYKQLFNKRAKFYKEMGLKNENLSETDFKRYILEHYTFLARPVIFYNNEIFVGNSPKTVEKLLKTIKN